MYKIRFKKNDIIIFKIIFIYKFEYFFLLLLIIYLIT